MKTQHPLYEVRLPRLLTHQALVRPAIALVAKPATNLTFTSEIQPDGALVISGKVLQPDVLISRYDESGQQYYLRFRAQEIVKLCKLFAAEPQVLIGHSHQAIQVTVRHSTIEADGSWSLSLVLDKSLWRSAAGHPTNDHEAIELAAKSNGTTTWHPITGFSLEAFCMRLLVVGRTDPQGEIKKLRKYPRLIKAKLSADLADETQDQSTSKTEQIRLFWQEAMLWLQQLLNPDSGAVVSDAGPANMPESTTQPFNNEMLTALTQTMTQSMNDAISHLQQQINDQATVIDGLKQQLQQQIQQQQTSHQSLQQAVLILTERVTLLAEAPAVVKPTAKKPEASATTNTANSIADQMVVKLRQISKARQAFD